VLDTPTTTGTTPTDTASPGDEPLPEPGEPPFLLTLVAVVLQVAALGVLLVGLFLAVRWLWGLRIRRRVHTPEVEFDVVEAPQRVAAAVANGATEQRLLLLGGTPRNGIVACWNRFEVQAAAAGVPRRPWETSSEYTLRILDLARADTHAVAALAELFREARFSEHELGERARRRAVALLDEIHASLGRRHSGVGS
jgi:ABC-type transporter Mla MlaB component